MKSLINYFTNMSKIKLVVVFVIFVILLALTGFIIFTPSSSKDIISTNNNITLTLEPTPGTTISIGKQTSDELVIGKQIVSTNSLKDISIPSGVYIVKFTGTSDYQDAYQSININKSTVIKTPDLKYTYEKLEQLLIDQKPAIQNTVTSVLPNSGYQIDKEVLLENGNWYGARLKPSIWYDSIVAAQYTRPADGTEDMLRVILKNDNGQWKIMAAPSIIFAIADYPDIPQNVIRATNKLGFN